MLVQLHGSEPCPRSLPARMPLPSLPKETLTPSPSSEVATLGSAHSFPGSLGSYHVPLLPYLTAGLFCCNFYVCLLRLGAP